MNGEEITFWEHIVDREYFTEIINYFDGVLQSKFTLLSNTLCCINSDWNGFAIIERGTREGLDIIEFANRIGQELL